MNNLNLGSFNFRLSQLTGRLPGDERKRSEVRLFNCDTNCRVTDVSAAHRLIQ
jgi:hypothetical protein